jgi:hypothetical protein
MTAVLEIRGDAKDVKRMLGEVSAQSVRAAAIISAAFRTSYGETTRAAREAGRAAAQAATATERVRKRSAKAAEDAERRASQVAGAEGNYRKTVYKGEADAAKRHADDVASARERAEVRATRASRREGNIRSHAERQRAREAAQLARQIGGGAIQVAGQAHGMVQGVRETRAARETRMNDFLIQTGADRREARGSRADIEAYILSHHLDADATIGAIGEAQSRFNALGGETPAARQAALQSTLGDIDFANIIDPNNMGGLVSFGAMLRGKVDEGTRRNLLRSATGISFQGSVETDQALQSALPGLLQSVASMTSGAPAAQRDEITRSVITDFLAQIQTVAATGGRVGVTSNRIGNLRTALGSGATQNRLAQALVHRGIDPAHRAEFDQVFTRGRNGQYTMNQDVVNSPSRVAALFGHMFNNDPTAVRNFLRTPGVGGRQQLLNRPEAGLLTSYFAEGADAQGRTRRQYDTVNELARATITPEREAEIRAIRGEEDRNSLNDNANNYTHALGDNTSALNKFSNAVVGWASKNPVLASAATTVGGAVAPSLLGRAGSALGGVARAGAGGIGRLVAGGAGLLADVLRPSNQHAGGTTDFFDDAAAIRAHMAAPVARTEEEQLARGAQVSRAATTTTTSERALALQRGTTVELGPNTIAALQTNPIGQAQARAEAASGGNAPPPESRNR